MKPLLVALAWLGSYFCANGQAIDTLVDVGGYKLHFTIVKGRGLPILFESGGGDDGTVWNGLIKKLQGATGTTMITYDRAGTGKSGIDTSRISILSEVKGLETGLAKLGFTANVFLVAHSLGGSYSILYSSRNPAKVKGCVFIDINLPCFMTKQKAGEIKDSYASLMEYLKKQRIGVYYLLKNYEDTNNLLRVTPFPSFIPATVIGSDIPPYKGVDSAKWKNCVRSFGTLQNHAYVLGKGCGHYVFNDNPDLVAAEITKLYRRLSFPKQNQTIRRRAF